MVHTIESPQELPQTIESVGFSLADAAHRLTRCPAVVVVRDPATRVASVVAASASTDRRVLGMPVSPTSAAGRACLDNITVQAASRLELLGGPQTDRRHREGHGVVFSLLDGKKSVGALVVFAPPDVIGNSIQGDLVALTEQAGALIGHIVAVQFSKKVGLVDAITGHPNRPGLEQLMKETLAKQCALVCFGIDCSAPLEHLAQNALLRHIASILRCRLRDYDVAARVSEEEFALFLPDAPLDGALAVADRIRGAVSNQPFDLSGSPPLSCSFGVASMPETVSAVDELLAAAAKARREARESGPNRIASLQHRA
jgi:diguanylate cyclase (GGDEF)-like protein